MIAAGRTLAKAIDSNIWKAWRIDTPLKSTDLKIGPNSVDLTLGSKLLFPTVRGGAPVDPVADGTNLEWYDVMLEPRMILRSGDFCLGFARERFDVHEPLWIRKEIRKSSDQAKWMNEFVEEKMYFVPMYEGRSTCGRLGLAMHITAGFGDYGFDMNFTMEIQNVTRHDLVLTAGMRVAQLNFQAVTPDVAETFYNGAYAGKAGGPHPPVLGWERFMMGEKPQ